MRIFPTPQDAETAFYEALERADLELMMAVWSEDEEIVCVHPGGPRLAGQDQVRESWRQMFAGGASARLHVTQQITIAGTMVAVHSVHENFSRTGEARPRESPNSMPLIEIALKSRWTRRDEIFSVAVKPKGLRALQAADVLRLR